MGGTLGTHSFPERSRTDALRAARRAVAGCFLLNGTVEATWVSRIPAVQAHLHLQPAQLGTALLGTAAGALVAMPLAGTLVARHGSRRVAGVCCALFLLALPVLALAPGMVSLLLALVFYGGASGAMNVAMNAHGALVERRMGRPIMSSFHAMFSFGGIAGSAAGAVAAGCRLPVATHFALTGLLGLLVLPAIVRWLLPGLHPEERAGTGPRFAAPSGPLLALGFLCFCILFGERAMADWTGLYLTHLPGAPAFYAALGYAAFSAAMTGGRLLGDRLQQRFGPVRIVRWGSALAAAGLGSALLEGGARAGMAGFTCVGAGFACIVPLLFSAGSRVPGVPSSVGIAAVTTMGYLGFLTGPPVIGFVAQGFGLRAGLGVVALLSAAVACMAGRVGRAGREWPAAEGIEELPA